MARRVVVTGLGVIGPLGAGAAAHWDGLLAARPMARQLERFRASGFPVSVGAEVPGDALTACLPRLPRKQLKLYNRASTLTMCAAALAAEDARLSGPVADPERAGIALATFLIPYPIRSILQLLPAMEHAQVPGDIDMAKGLQLAMTSLNPLDLSLKVVPNLTAGHVAIQYGLKGFCRTVSDGPTGGLHAIAQAMDLVQQGELDLAFCGGAEATLEDFVFADLCASGLLARTDGQAESRPFAVGRSGSVAGEGAAILVLESAEHAVARGARVRAELLGFGAATGAATVSGLRESCGRAMAAALGSDRIPPDLLSANGDASLCNDQAEAEAIRAALPAVADAGRVYAPKAVHGALFSAAGPLEAASAILALEHATVPPTPNGLAADPGCPVRLSAATAAPAPGATRALVNALGAFGEAASLLIGRAC